MPGGRSGRPLMPCVRSTMRSAAQNRVKPIPSSLGIDSDPGNDILTFVTVTDAWKAPSR